MTGEDGWSEEWHWANYSPRLSVLEYIGGPEPATINIYPTVLRPVGDMAEAYDRRIAEVEAQTAAIIDAREREALAIKRRIFGPLYAIAP